VKYVSADFADMVSRIGVAVFVIPLISILEDVAVAKAFGMYLSSTECECWLCPLFDILLNKYSPAG
jgi:hypothetical protein